MKIELILKYFARVSTFMGALTAQIRFFQDVKLSIVYISYHVQIWKNPSVF